MRKILIKCKSKELLKELAMIELLETRLDDTQRQKELLNIINK